MEVITEQEISQALQSLLSDNNDNNNISVNDVVQHLESKFQVDLSHKLDFIQSQTHLFYKHNDAFAPNHNSLPPPAASSTVKPEDNATVTAPPPISGSERGRTKAKRRGGPGGLNKLCGVSPLLQAIVGHPELPRTEIVKQLWAYIRKNNLQDPNNRRKIICNDELRLVFETDCTDMFKMNKLLAKHIIALEPTKKSGAKKQKIDLESVPITNESPSIIISEALANFCGISEREILQSEVLRRIWEYINLNNLEDPLNPMVIICDPKLQELFGCESISALGIPEVLVSKWSVVAKFRRCLFVEVDVNIVICTLIVELGLLS
ncbi:hypothetical protein ACFE04_023997 [Oxalis oulophora]